jgi:hypothetical protein
VDRRKVLTLGLGTASAAIIGNFRSLGGVFGIAEAAPRPVTQRTPEKARRGNLLESRFTTLWGWLPLCLLALVAALAIPALALAQTSGDEVSPEQVPAALAAAIRTNETARAQSISSQFVGWCSAPNPANTPGTCASVVAIQSGYAKVVIGRAGGEGIGTFIYQQSGDTWRNLGQVAEGADAPPFPPSATATPTSAAAPAPPNTGSGVGTDSSRDSSKVAFLLIGTGLAAGGALAVVGKKRR